MHTSTVGRIAPTGFALNGKIYLGTGVDYASNGVPFYFGSSDFWEYNPAGTNWQMMNSAPIAASGAFSFAIGTQAYIGGGAALLQGKAIQRNHTLIIHLSIPCTVSVMRTRL